jgi:RimJ/RimL family protein N-acetyltransferase
MGTAFLHLSRYIEFLTFEPGRMAEIATRLIGGRESTLIVADDGSELVGMIGMWVYDHPLSGDRVAGEVFWWVDPHQRGRLGLDLWAAAEAWAKDREARVIQMIAPNDRVARLYGRRGYQKLETTYQRTL